MAALLGGWQGLPGAWSEQEVLAQGPVLQAWMRRALWLECARLSAGCAVWRLGGMAGRSLGHVSIHSGAPPISLWLPLVAQVPLPSHGGSQSGLGLARSLQGLWRQQ